MSLGGGGGDVAVGVLDGLGVFVKAVEEEFGAGAVDDGVVGGGEGKGVAFQLGGAEEFGAEGLFVEGFAVAGRRGAAAGAAYPAVEEV